AFAGFGGYGRPVLCPGGAVAGQRPERVPGLVGSPAPVLPGMDGLDVAAADVWATGVSPDSYPTEFIRDRLDELGVVPAGGLADLDDGARVLIGGAVTHRQRPATAGGVTFLNIEDETGMINVICTLGLWQRYHRVARSSPALLIRGVVEKADGVVSVLAHRIEPLPMRIKAKSRDFR
ncbi:OB-fold nucleic acid binding domain-containing protein, partial [Amycolatopsis mediterranei]|uniref:OB-fold nucleic acid binding domain-containing protein n=1 Tax=Amycolatopsis mediterranei TaxID=33910 RepID=UPI0033203E08